MKPKRTLCAIAILFVVMASSVFSQAPQPQQPPKGPVPTAPVPGQPGKPAVPVQPGQGQPGQGQPGVLGLNQPTERKPPAAEYAIAIIATLGILVIACMPTRKR